MKKTFIQNENEDSPVVSTYLNGSYQKIHGIWPIVDEKFKNTQFLGIGMKGGINKKLFNLIKKQLKDRFYYIHPTLNGPYFVKKHKYIYKKFDGVFDLDYKHKTFKSINAIYSMMSRSMPFKGFFWEPVKVDKEYDFSILTWGPSDKRAKRWDRAKEVIEFLCNKGMKGLIVTQRDHPQKLINDLSKKIIQDNQVDIFSGNLTPYKFHELMCKAKTGIFPNVEDAFPKHLIETLLADKPVVFAEDLLFGTDTLRNLSGNTTLEINFRDKMQFDTIYDFIKWPTSSSPRKSWIEKYHFTELSQIWAEEFNKVFHTNYKRLFFMNHIPRIKANNIL